MKCHPHTLGMLSGPGTLLAHPRDLLSRSRHEAFPRRDPAPRRQVPGAGCPSPLVCTASPLCLWSDYAHRDPDSGTLRNFPRCHHPQSPRACLCVACASAWTHSAGASGRPVKSGEKPDNHPSALLFLASCSQQSFLVISGPSLRFAQLCQTSSVRKALTGGVGGLGGWSHAFLGVLRPPLPRSPSCLQLDQSGFPFFW